MATSATQKPAPDARSLIDGAGLVLAGGLIAIHGYRVLRPWSSISAAYAGCGVLWLAAALAMLVGGAWVLGAGGRRHLPLRIGGVALLLAGGTWIAGALTSVIPCTASS
jgi:hypothetical protein